MNFLKKVKIFSVDTGLKLNKAKCSLMTVDREETLPIYFELIPDIECKDDVIYLGARIFNKGGSEEDIIRRLGMAEKAVTKLSRIWKDSSIRIETNKYLMKTLVFVIAKYKSES